MLRKEILTLDEADSRRVLQYIEQLQARPPHVKAAQDMPQTQIKWDSMTLYFGKVEKDALVERTFMFANVGTSPLKIQKVELSCTCLSAVWSESYIEPNDYGFITLTFDTKGKSGRQIQSAVLTLNAQESQQTVQLTGEVLMTLSPALPSLENPTYNTSSKAER